MTRFTVAWTVWLLAFVVIEWAAYINGGYAATATGHLLALMRSHPIAAVVVPTLFLAIAVHLLVDYGKVGG